jgi:hypothetical protein
MPDRLKPARSGVPFVVGGAAAVFVAVASQSLQWPATTTIVVGGAFAVLLAVVGPPLALLPVEIAEDRRAAVLAEAKLAAVRAEARARLDLLRKERDWREGRLKEEERAKVFAQIERERSRGDVTFQRLAAIATAMRATRSRQLYDHIELTPRPKTANARLPWVGVEALQGPTEVDDWRHLEGIINANEAVSAAAERVLVTNKATEYDVIPYGMIEFARDMPLGGAMLAGGAPRRALLHEAAHPPLEEVDN